jgi:hypothetical protein
MGDQEDNRKRKATMANCRRVQKCRKVKSYAMQFERNAYDGDSDIDENQPNDDLSEHELNVAGEVDVDDDSESADDMGVSVEADVGEMQANQNDIGHVGDIQSDENDIGHVGEMQPNQNDIEQRQPGGHDDPHDDDVEVEVAEIIKDFMWWFAKNRNKVTRAMMDELLGILRTTYGMTHLPTDCRSLEPKVNIPKNVVTTTSEDGLYTIVHFVTRKVFKHLFRGLSINDFEGGIAKVWLYIDGVTFTKSSRRKNEIWPVEAKVCNVRGLEEELVLLGFHHGGKPSADELMHAFFQDLKAFEEKPFRLKDKQVVTIQVVKVVADSPARDLLKSIKAYNSKNGCERCECNGVMVGHTMSFPARYDRNVTLRTDKRFRKGSQLTHHKRKTITVEIPPEKPGGKVKFRRVQTRIPSVFEDYSPKLDMVFDFILDPMHLCYLRVGDKFLDFLLEKTKNPIPLLKVRGKERHALSYVLDSYSAYSPREFARVPRHFPCVGKSGNFKATEFRQLFLYTGVPLFLNRVVTVKVGKVLKDKQIDTNIAKTFLAFHCALRILSDPEAIKIESNLKRAHFCMKRFNSLCRSYFGREFSTFAVHSMLHMANEVRVNQLPLDDLSTFISENSYRHLGNNIRSGNRPREQLLRAILKQRKFEKMWWPGGVRQKNAGRRKVQFKRPRRGKKKNPGKNRHAVCITERAYYDCDRIKDCYCEVTEVSGAIVHIKCDHFVVVDGGGPGSYVEGRRLFVERAEEAFDYPFPASEFGIFLDSGVSNDNCKWPIQSIKRKLYRLPFSTNTREQRYVIIPLLHKPLPPHFG